MDPESSYADVAPSPPRRSRRFIVGPVATVVALTTTVAFFAWSSDDPVADDRNGDVRQDIQQVETEDTVEVRELGFTETSGSLSWAAIVENTSEDYEVNADFDMDAAGQQVVAPTLVIPPDTAIGVSGTEYHQDAVSDLTMEATETQWRRPGKNHQGLDIGGIELEERPDRTRVTFQVESPYARVNEPHASVVLRNEDGDIVAGSGPFDQPKGSEVPPGSSEQYVDITDPLPDDVDPDATEVYLYFGRTEVVE